VEYFRLNQPQICLSLLFGILFDVFGMSGWSLKRLSHLIPYFLCCWLVI